MTTLVVDASVAIKWVVEEPGTQEALSLRQFDLLAPDLLIAECSNVLWKKVRRKEMRQQEAELAAGLLEHADVEMFPMRPLLRSALQLAITLDHPAYDCLYLALADARRCPFVTADDRLFGKVHASRLPVRVVKLSAAPEALGAR